MRKERNRNDERNYRKTTKSKRASQAKGITLVALVITIIIIIILATVTINMAFNGGIIDKAELASDMYVNDTAYTDSSMANVVGYLDGILNGIAGGETDEQEAPSDWDQTVVTPVLSDDNQWVPVPKGFTASTIEGEKSVNDGFVIKQGNNGGATSGVNEFVWIPVNDESLAEMYITSETPIALSGSTSGITATTSIYSNIRIKSGIGFTPDKPGTTNVREPDLILGSKGTGMDASSGSYSILAGSTQEMAEEMVEEYTATYESIAKYDGFYIGRYELTGTVESPTVQKGEEVSVNKNWYNLKKACTNLVQAGENYGAQSEMIYGNQWDEVMDWLEETGDKTAEQIYEDSSSWGNYSDYNTKNGYEEGDPEYIAEAGTDVLPTGSSEYWKANNIYDLAGNAMDWTQEAYDVYYRFGRGGFCTYSGLSRPAFQRYGDSSNFSNDYYSSRPALYVALNADQT